MNQPIPAYLGPSALAPDEERIHRIRLDRWIGYARAEAALAALEELMICPQRTRMPNLILVGVTNNGKSMIVEKFYRRYAIDEDGRLLDSSISTPVLKVQMPSAPDEKRFFGTLLAPLGVSDRLNERLPARQGTALKLMRAARVRILIIDELHNVLAGPRMQQRRFLNLLRWLGNELRIPLVAVGTAEALRAIQSDDQLANRFAPFALPLWQMGAEYLRLLNTLEVVLPLRRASGLAQAPLARKIMTLAEGILGEMITVVRAAAVHAITSGEERITLRTLDQLTFIAPSQRRYAAE
jgi:hypothetical protein